MKNFRFTSVSESLSPSEDAFSVMRAGKMASAPLAESDADDLVSMDGGN